MQKTQIFHIGFHKTGTTWFQKEFYPKVSNFHFIDRKTLQNEFFKGGDEKRDINQNLLFCDEEMSGNIHTGGNGGILGISVADIISEKYPNPKVIIFIRNQVSMIASSYLQYVKKGGNYSLKRYLYHDDFPDSHRAPLFSFEHFNYLKLIDYYKKKVGKENVFVYPYEYFKNDQHKFLRDYSEQHGFDLNIDSLNLEKKNPSYRIGNLYISRILNTFTRKDVLYKYYIFNITGLYDVVNFLLSKFSIGPKVKPKSLFDSKLMSKIILRYQESNSILSKEYNLDLKKYDYPLHD